MPVWKSVDVEVGMEEFSDTELVREILNRNLCAVSADAISKILQESGCPEDVIAPLIEWLRYNKVVDHRSLARWVESIAS